MTHAHPEAIPEGYLPGGYAGGVLDAFDDAAQLAEAEDRADRARHRARLRRYREALDFARVFQQVLITLSMPFLLSAVVAILWAIARVLWSL